MCTLSLANLVPRSTPPPPFFFFLTTALNAFCGSISTQFAENTLAGLGVTCACMCTVKYKYKRTTFFSPPPLNNVVYTQVGRGESELLHFAVHGLKPSGVEAPFPLVGLGSQPQLFEAVLKVHVVDARSGEPIVGASVTLSGAGSYASTSDSAVPSPSDPRALAAGAGSRLSSSSSSGVDSSSTGAHVPPGKSASSQAKWVPPSVVLVRHTGSEGHCEVRVDAGFVAGLPQEQPPVSAVNANAWPLIASQREAVAGSSGTSNDLASVMRGPEYGNGGNDDDENGDDGSHYSSDEENGGRSPRPENSEEDAGPGGLGSRKIAALAKARYLLDNPLGTPLPVPAPQPLQATVSAPGYAPLEHALPGLTWPLSQCLNGGEVRKTTLKLLPLLASSADLESAKERASKVRATALAADNINSSSGALAPIAAPSSSSFSSAASSSSSSRKPQPSRRGNSVDQPSPLPAPAGFNGTWHRAEYPISLTCVVPGTPPQALIESGSDNRSRSPQNVGSSSSRANSAQASGVLMVRLPPNALTAEDPCLDNDDTGGGNGSGDGAPCAGLVRVCLVASFYDAQNLPGPGRVVSRSAHVALSPSSSSSLLQGTVGFQISAFGALGEPLYLRKGVTAAIGLGTDPLNAPSPLAIDRNLSLARCVCLCFEE